MISESPELSPPSQVRTPYFQKSLEVKGRGLVQRVQCRASSDSVLAEILKGTGRREVSL